MKPQNLIGKTDEDFWISKKQTGIFNESIRKVIETGRFLKHSDTTKQIHAIPV